MHGFMNTHMQYTHMQSTSTQTTYTHDQWYEDEGKYYPIQKNSEKIYEQM